MSDRKKNIKSNLSEFLRYIKGEMSGEERNSLERELQKDPFSEEALEGYASVSHDNAEKDISLLQNRLKKRTHRRNRFIVYRIAASVAVLMVISSVFVIVVRNNSGKQLSEASIPSEPSVITKDNTPVEPVGKVDASEKPAAPKLEKSGRSSDINIASEKVIPVRKAEDMGSADKQTAGQAEDKKSKAAERASESVQAIAPGAVLSPEKTISHKETKAAVAKADLHFMINTDTSEFDMDEAIIPGNEKVRQDGEKSYPSSGYTPPLPVTGKTAYNKYIIDNLQPPDSTHTGQRLVVIVRFLIQVDGGIDSLRIVRSPGKSFSDEAIRLILSGPSWKPAVDNGKPIEDEVRVRIVFR